MATSLETGYWNSATRWQYPDENPYAFLVPNEMSGEEVADENLETRTTDLRFNSRSPTKMTSISPRHQQSPISSPGNPRNCGSPTFQLNGSPKASSPRVNNTFPSSGLSPSGFGSSESHIFLPPIPRRPSLVAESESAYNEHYSTVFVQGVPMNNETPGGMRCERRIRGKGKAPASFLYHHMDPRHYETKEQRDSYDNEDTITRIWGRINPGYCVVPYETEANSAMMNWNKEQLMPRENRFNLRVHRKDFKEEMALRKREIKERGEKS